MKKLLWTMLFATLMFACKDDDDSSPNLIGTWVFTKGVYTNCDDSDDNRTDTDTNGCEDDDCVTLTFSEGKKYSAYAKIEGIAVSFDGDYTQKGSSLTLKTSAGDWTMKIKVQGSTLTATYTDDCEAVETYVKQ